MALPTSLPSEALPPGLTPLTSELPPGLTPLSQEMPAGLTPLESPSKAQPGDLYDVRTHEKIPTIGQAPPKPGMMETLKGEWRRALPFVGPWSDTGTNELRRANETYDPRRLAAITGWDPAEIKLMARERGADPDWIDAVRGMAEIGVGYRLVGGAAEALAARAPALTRALFDGTTKTGYVLKSIPLAKQMASELGKLQSAIGLSTANEVLSKGGSLTDAVQAGVKASVTSVPASVGFTGGIHGIGKHGQPFSAPLTETEKLLRELKASGRGPEGPKVWTPPAGQGTPQPPTPASVFPSGESRGAFGQPSQPLGVRPAPPPGFGRPENQMGGVESTNLIGAMEARARAAASMQEGRRLPSGELMGPVGPVTRLGGTPPPAPPPSPQPAPPTIPRQSWINPETGRWNASPEKIPMETGLTRKVRWPRGETGSISKRTLATLGATGVGAAIGAATSEDHKVRNALIGAATGMAIVGFGGKPKVVPKEQAIQEGLTESYNQAGFRGFRGVRGGLGTTTKEAAAKTVPMEDPFTHEKFVHHMNTPPPIGDAQAWARWQENELSSLTSLEHKIDRPRVRIQAWATETERLNQVNAMARDEIARGLRQAGISMEDAAQRVQNLKDTHPAIEAIRDFYENIRKQIGNKITLATTAEEMSDLGRGYINRVMQQPKYHIGSGDTYHVFYSLADAKNYAKAHPGIGDYAPVQHWRTGDVPGSNRFRSKNQMKRFYDTEKELLGAGYRFLPDAENVLVRMNHYAAMQSKVFSNLRLAQDLAWNPGIFRFMRSTPEPGYTVFRHPVLARLGAERRLLEMGNSVKQAQMLAGRSSDEFLVANEWYPWVKAVYGEGLKRGGYAKYLRLASTVKAARLMIATFHGGAIALSGVVQGLASHPIEMAIITAKTVPRWARAIVFGEHVPGRKGIGAMFNRIAVVPRAKLYPELAADSITDGVKIAAPIPIQRHLADEVIRLGEEFITRHTLGKMGINWHPKPMSWAKKRFDFALWDVAFQDEKLMWHQFLKAKNAKYVKEGGLTLEDVGRAAAEQVNYAFGGHIWETLPGVLKDPHFRDWVTGLGFAPDWYISNWGNPIRAISKLVPRAGETAAQAAERRLEGQLAREYVKGIVAYGAILQAVNYHTTKRDFGTGYFTWNTPGNDPTQLKNLFSVYIGQTYNPEKGVYEAQFAGMGKHVAEALGAIDLVDPIGGAAGYLIGKIHPALTGPIGLGVPEMDWQLAKDLRDAGSATGRALAYLKHVSRSYAEPFWFGPLKQEGKQSLFGVGMFRLHKGTYYDRLKVQFHDLVVREARATSEGDGQELVRVYHELEQLNRRAELNGINGETLYQQLSRDFGKAEDKERRRELRGFINR